MSQVKIGDSNYSYHTGIEKDVPLPTGDTTERKITVKAATGAEGFFYLKIHKMDITLATFEKMTN